MAVGYAAGPADHGPARAIRSSASAIGIAKPIPWPSLAEVAMTPTTVPAPSRSGPPLLPALIAASVWIRPSRATRRPDDGSRRSIDAVEAGDDPARHGVRELAERAPDGDDELADGQRADARPSRAGVRPVVLARSSTSPWAASLATTRAVAWCWSERRIVVRRVDRGHDGRRQDEPVGGDDDPRAARSPRCRRSAPRS